jgi:hypothetical protein
VGATTALRRWLDAQRLARAAGAPVDPADGRRVMREVCDEAHREGARVEQLIVVLKQAWATLAPAPAGDGWSSAWRVGDRETLADLISLCIEEFYASAQAGARQSERGASHERATPEDDAPAG